MSVSFGKVDNIVEIFLKLESNDQAVANEVQQFIGEQFQEGKWKKFPIPHALWMAFLFVNSQGILAHEWTVWSLCSNGIIAMPTTSFGCKRASREISAWQNSRGDETAGN